VRRDALRAILDDARDDLAVILEGDYADLTDEAIADLLIELADAALPLGYVPGAGPMLERLDGLILRLLRRRIVAMVGRARARLARASS
jgi:hypothetical protein